MPSIYRLGLTAGRACILGALLLFAGFAWGQDAGERADTGGGEAQRFLIWEFQLTGNTVLEVRDIERAV